jgi:Holliday junction resolvase
MKPKSAHNKGKRFENLICQEIEAEGFGKARREIGSGSGTRKGDIFANIPFLIEAKNQKKLNWWQSIDQAKKQAEIGNWDRDKWALIVRDPRTPEKKPDIYAVIDFWEFLKLMKKDSEPRVKKPDKDLKWRLQTLKTLCNQIINQL